MYRSLKLAALTVGFALVLSGCHSSSPTPSPSTPGASPSTSPSQSPTPSPSPALARCKLAQLSVEAGPTQGAAGSTAGMFIFTNITERPCTLEGYPGMLMLDAGGVAISTDVIRGSSVVVPSIPVTVVEVDPGARVSFLYGYANIPTGAETCPTSTKVEITPPNAFGHAIVDFAMSPCGGKITVSPVRAGTSSP